MGKKFLRSAFTEQEIGEILTSGIGLEQVVYFTADRGRHLTPFRARTPEAARTEFGPSPAGDLLRIAIDRALKNGATLHLVRLLHLSDPTDVATITAVAADVDVPQRVGGSGDEYGFFLNELGLAGNNFSVLVENGTASQTFKATLSSTETGIEDEVYDDLSVDTDDARYFLTVLNNNNAGRLRGIDSTPNATPTLPDELPTNNTYPLTGGSNGTALNPASIIGDSAAGTGFFAANVALQTPLVLCGHQNISSDPAVVASGSAYGTLADILLFQEPPDHTSTADAIAFSNGTTPYSHAQLSGSFGALNYSRHTVFDVQAGVNVNVPTVGELAPLLTRAQNRNIGGAFWLAPAGGERGLVSVDVLGLTDDVGVPPRAAEADDLVGARYNPFVTATEGIAYWGNQTLEVDETSLLVNLHVRFLLIGIRRILKAAVDKSGFQPNEPTHWQALFLRVKPILDSLQEAGAFARYEWRGDQDAFRADDQDQLKVNNVADIALGKYRAELWLQPFSAIDNEIGVDMKITSTAVNFDELLARAA